MELKHLPDTNSLIYHLQPQTPLEVRMRIWQLLQSGMPAMSVITEIEVLPWREAKEEDLELLHSFIADSVVFPLTDVIKEAAIQIRKHHGLKLPDAIIAATAKTFNLDLVSRNEKDFKRVPGITVFNPWAA